MKKLKLLGQLTLLCALFFVSGSGFVDAFDTKTVCQPPLKTFSDGSSAFDISFPPGGGTNSDAKIRLPKGATVYSVKVDMVSAAGEIGTPYIWVPLSGDGDILQLKTSDAGEIVKYDTKISNPSRVTVMPGGDVWVASRTGSGVTRLSPLTGDQSKDEGCDEGVGKGKCGEDETIYSCPADCSGNACGATGSEDCRRYGFVDTYTASGEAKGVTFDSEGNIWVGDYKSGTLTKFTYSGVSVTKTTIANSTGYKGVYGMIGDSYGYIWMVAANLGSTTDRRIVYLNTSTNTFGIADACTVAGSNYLYGIGMDNEGNVLVANYGGGGACKIGGAKSGTDFGKVIATYSSPLGSRGIAADGNNNVWLANCDDANNGGKDIYVFSSNGNFLKTIDTGCSNVIGVAIDFDNNAWVVSNGSSHVLKYGAVGGPDEFDELEDENVGGSPYNYSDMTGLRTVPKSLTLGGIKTFLSGDTFTICSDGTTTCSDSGPCTFLTFFLSTCTPGASGECEVPLEIFSAMAGDYTLQNLEIIYGKEVPITIGGLVPCGRNYNDDNTPWDDKADCTLCHLVLMAQLIMDFLVKIAAVVAAFFLAVAGFMYIFAGGQPDKITLAKKIFSKVLIGFMIIFIAWIIVDTILVMFGYIDPLENNEWHIMC